jgi:adenosylhomocysteine nucleosidase
VTPPKVAIIAALPPEIAGLTRGTRPDPDLAKSGIRLHRIPGAVVVAAGMGASRATMAVEAALRVSDTEMLVSIGLAGACIPGLKIGTVLDANLVVDARTGERFESAARPAPGSASITLATIESIAGVAEKKRLRETYGASMVDMEAATVARLARAHGLAFRVLKAISDEHDFELAALNQFADQRGQFRTAAFAFHTAVRPALWKTTMHLGRASAEAIRALDQAVLLMLDRFTALPS